MGNIGAEYENTRHNIGFKAVEAFAKASTVTFSPGRYGDVAIAKQKGRTFILLKPNTYMNLSGKAVRYWMDQEKIPLENVLIITDDIALPIGTIRLRGKGGAGGHNGLKSIEENLATGTYARLRFGVGNEFSKGQQVNHVLGEWTAEEAKVIEQKLPIINNLIVDFGTMKIGLVMTNYNNK